MQHDAKIYCARPGSRLWEANFEASVLLTHQFGSSLVQKPSEIVTIEDSVDAKLNIGKPVVDRRVPEQFNIGRIYPILQKFILTYDRDGLYFFEPETSMLSFWSYTFKNILDLRIVKSYIYIWREDLQMNIISLQSLECLLLTTLINKQYYLCSELCLYYNDDMNDLIEKSQKVHLLANLKTKLNEIGANDMLYNIKPILDALENHRQRQHIGIKLENGIVLVENEHVQTKTEEFDLYLPEAVLEFNNGHSVESEIANKDLDNRSQDNKVKNEKNKMIIALHKLYVLNKTHKNAELTETSNLYQNTKFEDILLLFNKFIAFVKEKDDEDATNWCQEQIIKLTAKGDFNIAEIDISSLQHLNNCFIAINKSSDLYCKCNIPLPKAHSKKIEHSNLAIKLFKRVRDKSVFLNNIPFLYKYDLKMIGSLPEVISRLPVITQFSDKEVFKEIKGMLTYDSWDEIIKWYLKLRRGFCLNCGEDIDVDGTLSWSELGLLMIESIGANNAIRLLKRYSQYIPKGELDAKFYQTCLFTPTCADQASAVNFMEKAVNGDNSQEFGEMIGNFIQKMYLGNHLRIDKSNIQMGTCPVCKLPVDTSVLIEVKKCDCGHSYHSICFPVNNAICNICITTS
ncbi:hypothetical protein JTB14_030732 [Gonioctena quinquepunctata]|nr:hypothetical protein JTB14_030732 [Gonioctena quinquepunctata]